MSVLKKLKDFFSPCAVPNEYEPSGHAALHGNYMRTNAYKVGNDGFSPEALIGLSFKTQEFWEARQSTNNPMHWIIRPVSETIIEGKKSLDYGELPREKTYRFEETIYQLSILEQSYEINNHPRITSSEELGDQHFLALAEKEGFVQQANGKFAKPDETGQLVGIYNEADIARAQDRAAQALANNHSIVDSFSGKTAHSATQRLNEAFTHLDFINTLDNSFFAPILEIIKNIHENKIGMLRRQDNTGSDLLEKPFTYLASKEADVLRSQDKKALEHMAAIIVIEACTIGATMYFNDAKENAKEHHKLRWVKEFRDRAIKMRDKYFSAPDSPIANWIENQIMHGEGVQPVIALKAHEAFKSWRKDKIDNLYNLPRPSKENPLSLGTSLTFENV